MEMWDRMMRHAQKLGYKWRQVFTILWKNFTHLGQLPMRAILPFMGDFVIRLSGFRLTSFYAPNEVSLLARPARIYFTGLLIFGICMVTSWYKFTGNKMMLRLLGDFFVDIESKEAHRIFSAAFNIMLMTTTMAYLHNSNSGPQQNEYYRVLQFVIDRNPDGLLFHQLPQSTLITIWRYALFWFWFLKLFIYLCPLIVPGLIM